MCYNSPSIPEYRPTKQQLADQRAAAIEQRDAQLSMMENSDKSRSRMKKQSLEDAVLKNAINKRRGKVSSESGSSSAPGIQIPTNRTGT